MIEIRNLGKYFEGDRETVKAVDGVSFSVPEGKIFTLLGPSGCGKSTTLRCVAGLERPEEGEIKIGEKVIYSSKDKVFIPPHQRDIGMVFQSYAIWPHMKVYDNVAYPLKIKKMSRDEVRKKTLHALHTVGLEKLEDRLASQLSGGQQQRVALARALVKEPEVLLLDEPLSNLDAQLRKQMRSEIRDLQRRLNITTLYVTHDQIEALAISDYIAVMNLGKILDLGGPREIYDRPSSRFTADFIGQTNILRGKTLETKGEQGRYATSVGELSCRLSDGVVKGDDVLIFVRPENIRVFKEKPGDSHNILEAKIKSLTFLGEYTDCQLVLGEELLWARLHPQSALKEQEPVYIQVDHQASFSIPAGDVSVDSK